MLLATKEEIAEDLWLYGETELAVVMLDADEATHRRIMEAALRPRKGGGRFRSSRISALLAGAAVDVLTSGARRATSRSRPMRERHVADFWERVGAHRDTRDKTDPMNDTEAIFKREFGIPDQ